MIKGIGLDGFVLIVVVGISWVVLRVYEQRRKRALLTKTAYFAGGPLNGTEQKLEKWPEVYKYTYDKPRMVTLVEGETPQPVQTWFDATYEHQGSGVYEYKGSQVSSTKVRWDTD